jgi:hypothetical protein
MSEIQWSAPGKVVGTTDVVLSVIVGSTTTLLSVNALLAELSDHVFAGCGSRTSSPADTTPIFLQSWGLFGL